MLHLVAGGDANEDAAFVSTLLAFEPRIDIAQLAAPALLPDAQIASALGVLASSGQVGFDLAAGAYFHRPLPVQAGLLDTLHPGWPKRASWWPAAGAARRRGAVHGAIGAAALPDRAGRRARARPLHLPWHAKYQGTRGPCKHTLAVRMFLDPLNAPGAGA